MTFENSDRVQIEGDPVAYTVGGSLDHLIGSWSDEEAAEIERALKHFEAIDEATVRVLLDSNPYGRADAATGNRVVPRRPRRREG